MAREPLSQLNKKYQFLIVLNATYPAKIKKEAIKTKKRTPNLDTQPLTFLKNTFLASSTPGDVYLLKAGLRYVWHQPYLYDAKGL